MELPYFLTWAKQKDAHFFKMDRAHSSTFYTDDKDIIDLSSISYQAHFGFNPPPIIKAIKDQLDFLPITSPKANFKGKIEITNKLLNYMKLPNGKIFYTTGGAETIENALKMARQISGKKIVLSRAQSYHGATMGALLATGDWRNPPHLLPREEWSVRIPEPYEEKAIEKTRDIILKYGPENIAAFILETITGGNGVIIPTSEWWEGIQKLCDEFHIFLILDEVVCGFMRTGLPFGFHHYNLRPDFITCAKGISGGLIPFGALWTNPKIADYYKDTILSCGLTNYGHPLGIAALGAVLDWLEEETFIQEIKKRENQLSNFLNSIQSFSCVTKTRQMGLLAAIDLTTTISPQALLNHGLYIVTQTNRLILAPALTISEAELDLGCERLAHVLKSSGDKK